MPVTARPTRAWTAPHRHPGVTVTQTVGTTAVTEGGATDTFSVVLNNRPVSNVTITVNPGTQVTALPSPLVFTAANWNVPQDVTVAAVDDAVAEGVHNESIGFTVSSADPLYNGAVVAPVAVSITDNETTGLSIGDAAVAEGDAATATLTFTVSLSPPSALGVTVPFSTANQPGAGRSDRRGGLHRPASTTSRPAARSPSSRPRRRSRSR